jgi:hypothetical protein
MIVKQIKDLPKVKKKTLWDRKKQIYFSMIELYLFDTPLSI